MEERFKNSNDLSQRKMEIDDENYKRHKKNTNNKILKYRIVKTNIITEI